MRQLLSGASVDIGRGRTTHNSIDLVDLGAPGPPMTIQRPRSIRWLVLCGVLLIGVIATGTALMVDYFRERALANSKRELGNTALLLARHLDQELEELELAQKKLIEQVRSLGIASREEFEREMSSRDVHLMLRAKIDVMPRPPQPDRLRWKADQLVLLLAGYGRECSR